MTYSVTIKVDPTYLGNIGHAFITFSASGRPDITIGFYPSGGGAIDNGVVRNDLFTHVTTDVNSVPIGVEHPYTFSKTLQVSEQQFANMLEYSANVANNPADKYNGVAGLASTPLTGSLSNVCTDFVRDILAVGELKGSASHYFRSHHAATSTH